MLSNFKDDYSNNISLLNSIFDSNSCSSELGCHKNTKNYYEITKEKIEELTNISEISSTRPSGGEDKLIPNFENEFSDLSNISLYGGLIYNSFKYVLENNINKIDEIQSELETYISNINIKNQLNDAYNSILIFDKTIASAASIMVTNFINDKKIILNFYEFMYMFIVSAYFVVFTCVFIFFLVYEREEYTFVYYLLIGFMNVLAFLSIWEIVLSALFHGINLFCKETPRVMKFLFTEDYIKNGNTEDYPPKFGNKDSTMTELFSICLNGDGDLLQKFISKTNLNSYLTQTQDIKEKVNDIFTKINNVIQKSSVSFNSYDILKNSSYILLTILKLEEMYNNLYLTSDYFGDDDIKNIINNIRINLDYPACGMTNEYFVIKKSDCPKYSVILNTISSSEDSTKHCYIIQDLSSGSTVNYPGLTCDNNYINNAINFIKEINNLLKKRIKQLKDLQNDYILTWKNMNSEINSINSLLDNIQYLLYDEINNKYSFANCSSIKYDLIDFSEFLSDKVNYRITIMIIFSSLIGILGYILLCCILIILRQIESNNNPNLKNTNEEKFLKKDYSKISQNSKKSKYRNIRPPNYIKSNDFSDFENSNDYKKYSTYDNDKYRNRNMNISGLSKDRSFNKNRSNIIYNNIRKIEMRNLGNKKNK